MTPHDRYPARRSRRPPRRARRADPGSRPHPDAEPARAQLPRARRLARRPDGARRLGGRADPRRGRAGDSDRYPRWNLVARIEGARPGDCVHFNGHHDVVEVGQRLDPRSVRRRGRGRQDLRPRRLRHEGRPGHRRSSPPRRSSPRAPTLPARSRSPARRTRNRGGYGGVAYLAEQGYFSPTGSST